MTGSVRTNPTDLRLHADSWLFDHHDFPLGQVSLFIGEPGETKMVAAVGTYQHWAVAWWPIILLTAIYPVVCFVRYRRGLKDASRGLCPSCGYDLRASPDRCPECGRAAAESSARP